MARTTPPEDDLADALNGTGPYKYLYEGKHSLEPKTTTPKDTGLKLEHLIAWATASLPTAEECRRQIEVCDGWLELERIAKGDY